MKYWNAQLQIHQRKWLNWTAIQTRCKSIAQSSAASMHLRSQWKLWLGSSYLFCSLSLRSIARTMEQFGMQLRTAAERGKVREVKRLLEAGAKLTKDSVSGTESDLFQVVVVVVLKRVRPRLWDIYISRDCCFSLLYRTASLLYTRLLNGGTQLLSNCS